VGEDDGGSPAQNAGSLSNLSPGSACRTPSTAQTIKFTNGTIPMMLESPVI
jgi:hypothetical protein